MISSFIESNLHPELNPMIPPIIIDEEKFGVSIYDKKNDLLLLAWDIPWLTEKDGSELHEPDYELDDFVGDVLRKAGSP